MIVIFLSIVTTPKWLSRIDVAALFMSDNAPAREDSPMHNIIRHIAFNLKENITLFIRF